MPASLRMEALESTSTPHPPLPTSQSTTSASAALTTQGKPRPLNKSVSSSSSTSVGPSPGNWLAAHRADLTLDSMTNTQLPKQLEAIPPATEFLGVRHRWNTNEEIAALLIAFDKHQQWQQSEIKLRPPSGSMLLYNRNKVRHRKDNYCWKKRKDGKTIREDHMKLKVQGLECIYGSYVHSAILPTFHRRCYWLLQNPDIVLVHYLNVPFTNNAKLSIPVVSFANEKKEWTKEELVEQLRPMFCVNDTDDRQQEIDQTISILVHRLIDHQEQQNPNKCVEDCKKKCVQRAYSLDGGTSQSTGSHCPSSSSSQPINSNILFTSDCMSNKDSTSAPFILNLGSVVNNNLMLVAGQSASLSMLSTCNKRQQQYSGKCNSQPTTRNSSFVTEDQSDFQSRSHSLSQDLSDIQLCEQNSNSSFALNKIDSFSARGESLGNNYPQVTSHLLQNLSRDVSGPANTAPSINTNKQFGILGNDKAESAQIEPGTDSQMTTPDVQKLSSAENLTLEDFNLDLMSSGDKESPTESNGKVLANLTDCLDGFHANLSPIHGSDMLVNLDQLDTLDLPDIEKICNDISNESNSPTSQENHVHIVHKENTCTDINDINPVPIPIQNGCVSERNVVCSNNRVVCSSSGKTDFETVTTRECLMMPEVRVCQSRGSASQHPVETPNTIAVITDFCPDWAYSEGHTKMLVTGPWHSHSGTYTVLMDGRVIATTLVQPGVLRCFVPEHNPGLVPVQVSCDGQVVSNTVIFEYKEKQRAGISVLSNNEQVKDWFTVSDTQLQQQLVDKLDSLEACLTKVPDSPSLKKKLLSASSPSEMDVCLSRHVDGLSSRLWLSKEVTSSNGTMGLSLLHLAAALGYHRLVQALTRWRSNNSSWQLDYEVDAHSMDLNTCSPLMWACARGHLEASVALYNWNQGPLHVFNSEGHLPLLVARRHGHHQLADHLEHNDKQITSSLSTSRDIFSSKQRASPVPDRSSFMSSLPAATSTPQSKVVNNSENIYKTAQQVGEQGENPGMLHIQIPRESVESSEVAHSRDGFTRRQSEQMLAIATKETSNKTCSRSKPKLRKRLSVDLLPCEGDPEPAHFSPTHAYQRPVREANSEPHLTVYNEHMTCELNPMLSEHCNNDLSPEGLMQIEAVDGHGRHLHEKPSSVLEDGGPVQLPINMDTDDVSDRSTSPFIDVEKVSSDDEDQLELMKKKLVASCESEDPKHQMVHLAKQIIAAMPERIKSSPSRCDELPVEEFERERSSSYSSLQSASPRASSSYCESFGEDSGISTPMLDSVAFDEYRYSDRYSDLGTPASSLSPDSTCLHSPYSPYNFHLDSPPPTTAEFTEYFNAPATFMEKDFSQLTLSDQEQRKLYEAAKVIQNAYRTYRDKQFQQQRKEIEAAVLIQSYYRRYKQYAYYKKMTQAAVLIQSQFRSYYAQKRFKKSRDAAVVIQNQYRSYKEHERLKKGGNKSVIQRYRSHYQRKLAGAGKGSRVVQIVPESVDGSHQDPSTSEGHQDTEEESASLVEQEVDGQGQEGSGQGE